MRVILQKLADAEKFKLRGQEDKRNKLEKEAKKLHQEATEHFKYFPDWKMFVGRQTKDGEKVRGNFFLDSSRESGVVYVSKPKNVKLTTMLLSKVWVNQCCRTNGCIN